MNFPRSEAALARFNRISQLAITLAERRGYGAILDALLRLKLSTNRRFHSRAIAA